MALRHEGLSSASAELSCPAAELSFAS
jgi:hypothetical protein